jgi:hypothetical protein
MMTEQTNHPQIYTIEIAGQLDAHWAAWFDDLTITPTAAGNTQFSGPVPDQAALYGVLKRLNNLGLKLISVNPQPQQNK